MPAVVSRGTSEQRSARRYAHPTRKLVRTGGRLLEELQCWWASQPPTRAQAEPGKLLRRPAGAIPRRLGDDEDTAHTKEWRGALRGNARGSKRSRGNCASFATPPRVTAELLSSPAEDFGVHVQSRRGAFEETTSPLLAIQKHPLGRWNGDGEDEAGQPSAGTEVQERGGRALQQRREGMRVFDMPVDVTGTEKS